MHNDIQLSDIPLPSTDNLERQVIYDVINNGDIVGDMLPIVSPEMFASETRRGIWTALVDMYNEGKPIDMTTAFSKTGQPFIDEIVSRGVQYASATASLQHAAILRSAHLKRKAYFSALKLLQASADAKTPDDAIFAGVQELTSAVQSDTHSESEVPLKNVLDTIAEEVQERYQLAQEGRPTRCPTGFPSLDYYTYGGWGKGQLIILAARPSVGKTSLMLKFAREAAGAGFPTCIFTVEMTNQELGQKALYSTNMVNPLEVSSGNMNWENFELAVGRLSGLPIYLNDHSKNVDEIVSRISINARAGKCKIALIDYLGLMDSGKDGRTPLYQALGHITATLKVAAKRAGIPIILLCQLNRNAAQENRPPQLTDLRDSGSIEQDADIVMMLSQKTEVGLPDGAKQDVDIWLRKNRQSSKDVRVTIRPNGTYSDFYEVESR